MVAAWWLVGVGVARDGAPVGGEYVTEFGAEDSGNGQFKRPYGITVDSNGNAWVADTNNDRVEEFNSKGEYVTQFGSKGSGTSQFTFSFPIGLTVTQNAKYG